MSYNTEGPLKVEIDYKSYYYRELDSCLIRLMEYVKSMTMQPEKLRSLEQVNNRKICELN